MVEFIPFARDIYAVRMGPDPDQMIMHHVWSGDRPACLARTTNASAAGQTMDSFQTGSDGLRRSPPVAQHGARHIPRGKTTLCDAEC